MKMVLVAGPPAAGKTSVLKHALGQLFAGDAAARALHVAKYDCLTGSDAELYQAVGVTPAVSLSGDVCPDHHFAVELGQAYLAACEAERELMVIETAGLCDRCSPFLARVPAVGVLSVAASLQSPSRLRAIVGHADLLVLTRGELVSQAEREVFRAAIADANPSCEVIEVNGLTGEGAGDLAAWISALPPVMLLDVEQLRYPLPRGTCELCTGGI